MPRARAHAPRRSAPSELPRGFTLIEVMVVVVILGMLAALVVPNVERSAEQASVTRAAADVRTIAEAVRMFRLQHGRLPTLEQLTTPDAKGLTFLDRLPQDPWQSPYGLREGPGPRDFEVVSAGPDRQPGSDDDISSRTAP